MTKPLMPSNRPEMGSLEKSKSSHLLGPITNQSKPKGQESPLQLNYNCLMLEFYRTEYDKYSEDPEFKPASRHTKDLFEEV